MTHEAKIIKLRLKAKSAILDKHRFIHYITIDVLGSFPGSYGGMQFCGS